MSPLPFQQSLTSTQTQDNSASQCNDCRLDYRYVPTPFDDSVPLKRYGPRPQDYKFKDFLDESATPPNHMEQFTKRRKINHILPITAQTSPFKPLSKMAQASVENLIDSIAYLNKYRVLMYDINLLYETVDSDMKEINALITNCKDKTTLRRLTSGMNLKLIVQFSRSLCNTDKKHLRTLSSKVCMTSYVNITK
jgi:hypothetical protein